MKQFKNTEAKELADSFTSKSVNEVALNKSQTLSDIFYIKVVDQNSTYTLNDIVYYSEEERDHDFNLLVNTRYVKKTLHEKQI